MTPSPAGQSHVGICVIDSRAANQVQKSGWSGPRRNENKFGEKKDEIIKTTNCPNWYQSFSVTKLHFLFYNTPK